MSVWPYFLFYSCSAIIIKPFLSEIYKKKLTLSFLCCITNSCSNNPPASISFCNLFFDFSRNFLLDSSIFNFSIFPFALFKEMLHNQVLSYAPHFGNIGSTSYIRTWSILVTISLPASFHDYCESSYTYSIHLVSWAGIILFYHAMHIFQTLFFWFQVAHWVLAFKNLFSWYAQGGMARTA